MEELSGKRIIRSGLSNSFFPIKAIFKTSTTWQRISFARVKITDLDGVVIDIAKIPAD